MSKQTRDHWGGWPHQPPLNWQLSGKPVVRKVVGLPDVPLQPTSSEQGYVPLIAVSFTNSHWICILQALHHYGQLHKEDGWSEWYQRMRSTILDAMNANHDDKLPVAVSLPVKDWRGIWVQVCATSQKLGGKWLSWFDWLGQSMIAQIKGG